MLHFVQLLASVITIESMLLLFYVQHVLREASDFRVALQYEDVLRSATTMCGAQSVMMRGALLMHKWPADNWGSLPLVKL